MPGFFLQAKPPALDDLLLIRDAELRACWKNAQQIIPESQILPDLAQRELALNLGKRKRDSLQRLGHKQIAGGSMEIVIVGMIGRMKDYQGD